MYANPNFGGKTQDSEVKMVDWSIKGITEKLLEGTKDIHFKVGSY